MGSPPLRRSRGWRSRPVALASALLALTFALAERADAQAQAPAAPVWGATQVAGQVVQQASQTVQAAGAVATTVQVQPTNVAAPVTVKSPGATTAIAQTNTAGAGSSSANSSSTNQSAGQSQGGGGKPASSGAGTAAGQAPQPASQPASGGQAQASGQASQTVQNAGSQATTVQVAPVNIAIPITIGSPGSSIVIIQTNGASSAATAANGSSTTQTSGQTQTGIPAAAPPGQPGTVAPVIPPPSAVIPPSGSGTSWVWNWVWNWTWNWTIPVPPVQPRGVPPWTAPGDEPRPAASARPERRAPAPASVERVLPVGTVDGAGLDQVLPPPKTVQPVSSNSVQRPTSASEPVPTPFFAVPLPTQPALTPGGGFVPAGLLVGALALLALYLGSLGLLFGRLSLASAPWRHQAYLTPQQRPG